MASKLRVEELRDELSKRGLSTTGIKPTLVKRLEVALRKESNINVDDHKITPDGNNKTGGRKRGRSGEDGHDVVDDGSQSKLATIERFREMSVIQLREEAARRGVSSKGVKKELVERIYVHEEAEEKRKSTTVDGQGKDKNEEEEKKEDKEKQTVEASGKVKLVKATKKGSAVLDQWLSDTIKNQYHVLQVGDEIYDAMLNQTNVGDNNNKFYVLQVLESDGSSTYMVYNRWGRVGVKGQDKLSVPYTSREAAIQEFMNKFYAKTKNNWCDRKEFVSYPKGYTWLEMDYNQNEQEVRDKPCSTKSITPQESQLETGVAEFISLICNVGMMKQQMMEIGYNAEKLPLGKLSKSTISKGYNVLKRIADVIGQNDRGVLEQLSGEFYTVIPHDFGFKKMSQFIIDTPQKLKSKLQMVEALGEIELATKLLEDNSGEAEEDPFYVQYKRLKCELTPVKSDSKEFSLVENYLKNTHGDTHSGYTVDIVQLFKVSREGENERFEKYCGTKNRMLLWHGSRLTNWTGILSQGLRIAPPEAPVTGYMFGKGVYFADMFSKSANYCYASHSTGNGVLLLCEVALGEMRELLDSDYNADRLPKGKLSTKGVGRTAPDPSEARVLEDGVVVPYGKPVPNTERKGVLQYNEYIVYNVDQIRMRYLLQVNFNFRR